MQQLQILTGKGAVFVRGFMETFEEGARLFDCQAGGRQAVEALQETFSVPYMSKLSRLLQTEGVIVKRQRGRKHYVYPGQHFTEFKKFLAESDYGLSLDADLGLGDLDARSEVLDFVAERHALMIHKDRQLSRTQFAALNKKFKAGDLVIIFAEADATVVVKGVDKNYRVKELGK